ncbi:MAG UNVERIFIED_CONTAM: 3-hydroxyacyl-ACP dehydratase FabZ [Rickettsiaceae bacterium]|jgi:3-hydroxyacyl-[acyl-carrier-protein] dehydratase
MSEVINITEILSMIPHRYPLLLVDRIIEYEAGKSIVGIKNVTFNEPHFTGHFPGHPVMPGVLIIEAMAQVAAVLVAKTINAKSGEKLVYFMGIDNAKFRKVVEPGDRVYIYAKIEQQRGDAWKFSAEAKVDEQIVAQSSFSAMVRDK